MERGWGRGFGRRRKGGDPLAARDAPRELPLPGEREAGPRLRVRRSRSAGMERRGGRGFRWRWEGGYPLATRDAPRCLSVPNERKANPGLRVYRSRSTRVERGSVLEREHKATALA